MKILQTPQQRANTIDALYNMLPSIPEYNLELWCWRRGDCTATPTCNTTACFGGWCAWWPAFRAQGLYADEDGTPCMDDPEGGTLDPFEAAYRLFGSSEPFNVRSRTAHDDRILISDHEVVRRRLQSLLNYSKVVG